MIFFLLHQLLKPLLDYGLWHQTANLTVFLIGIVLWTYLWVFINDVRFHGGINNFLVTGLSQGFAYFLLSDIMAIAIIYKNYWKRSIMTEFEEIFKKDDTKIVEKPAKLLPEPEKSIPEPAKLLPEPDTLPTIPQ